MKRRMAALLCLLALVCLSMLTPAFADERVELSWDGDHWVTDLHGELFDPEFRWVPGDADTQSFFVRNPSSDAAELTIEPVVERLVDGLGHDDGFALAVRVNEHPWQPVTGTETFKTELGPGDAARIDARAEFDYGATTAPQNARLGLQFLITLEGRAIPDDPAAPSEPATPEAAPGQLPVTGTWATWLLVLAAACIGVGSALLLPRRQATSDG